MECITYPIRQGYDGKRCLVHARCCCSPGLMVATAQYLDVKGSDLFSGILASQSLDDGKTWGPFVPQAELAPIESGKYRTVGCDATPMYHQKTGKILLLGQTAEYKAGWMQPTGRTRHAFYSVFDYSRNAFGKMKFLTIPAGSEYCGNGSGQSIELENGDVLIPMYYRESTSPMRYSTMVIRCRFDGDELTVLEVGEPLSMPIGRGLYEPSIVCFRSQYYLTIRGTECGFLARSTDGLHYTDLQLWKWEDGSILQNYETQQHWMKLGNALYLVYTRRGADNDHVFRHRAPLFAARVENMRLVRASEQIIVEEKGARLGNFGVAPFGEDKAIVMAAEWMQPKGCEKYGSDNRIYVSICK